MKDVKVNKWLLAMVIGYSFLPVDIIPDAIPLLGTIDDTLVWMLQIMQVVKSGKQ
jgi:uncharacterized membrane protein YkvA (DUF1232 family)